MRMKPEEKTPTTAFISTTSSSALARTTMLQNRKGAATRVTKRSTGLPLPRLRMRVESRNDKGQRQNPISGSGLDWNGTQIWRLET